MIYGANFSLHPRDNRTDPYNKQIDVHKLTDSESNYVTYGYDDVNGVLNSFTDANAKTTSYAYDPKSDKLNAATKSADGKTVSNSYAYDYDRIKTITHNNGQVVYNFGYDSLGNNKTVSVGTNNLITNNYEARTGKLLDSTYGNGQKVGYDYDSLNRITAKKIDDVIRFRYEFDASGNLGYKQDILSGINFRYVYDFANRLSRISDSAGNITALGYDLNNNNNGITQRFGNSAYITNYGYTKDNKPQDTIYNRYAINNGQVEYFPLNINTDGTNLTKAVSQNAVYEKNTLENYKQTMSAYETTTNLVSINPSFESDTSEWTTGDWSSSTGAWRAVNGGVFGGRAIESYDSDNKTDGSTTNAVSYQDVVLPSALTAPASYTLSAYAMRIGSTHPTLGIDCLDANGNEIAGGYINSNKTISQENQWNKISGTFTVPSGTKKIRVLIRSSVKDKDVVRFDAVQLEAKGISTPYTDSSYPGTKVLYNLGIDKSSGTLGIWFNTKADRTVRSIISNEGSNRQIFNMYISDDNYIKVNVRNSADSVVNLIDSNTGAISPGQWYFAAYKWQYDGTNLNGTLYINGTSVESRYVSDFKDFIGGQTAVGSSIFGYSQLNGSVEQFMYSKNALSDSDILAIYNKRKDSNI